MGILDRLGQVLRSYLNDDDDPIFRDRQRTAHDPDLNAAYEELDDYLNGAASTKNSTREQADFSGASAGGEQKIRVPEELRPDFAELELAFGASADECKEAYKRLLKIHHPDRHANHEGNFKKATAKSARINAAYDRISQWRERVAL